MMSAHLQYMRIDTRGTNSDIPKKILAYVDPRPESIATLERAVVIAKRTGASVTAVDIVQEASMWRRRSQRLARAVDARRAHLEGLVGPLRRERASIDVAVRSGKPTAEIVRAVIGDNYNLVIKSAKGRAEGGLSLFGTTAMHLIRKCPCPVLVLGPSPARLRPKILAAIDPGWDGDEVSSALAQKVIAHAAALAQYVDGDLHALHAWGLSSEHLLRRHVSVDELARFSDRQHQDAKRLFYGAMAKSRASLPLERLHLQKGRPEITIPTFAKEGGFDVIVMGSVGRSGLAGLFIGEMAGAMLARTDCGVLCVKPDGFVSPVRPAALEATAA